MHGDLGWSGPEMCGRAKRPWLLSFLKIEENQEKQSKAAAELRRQSGKIGDIGWHGKKGKMGKTTSDVATCGVLLAFLWTSVTRDMESGLHPTLKDRNHKK